jgi:protoporphyrinogen oxidase
MDAESDRILILGGGPCGLGAAWRLAQSGHTDWTLLEAEPHVGGLAASFVDPAGFTWDIGGHVLFSHYDVFTAAVVDALEGRFLEHEREAWIYLYGRFVPYPFQHNIHRLPNEVCTECLDGLRAADRGLAPKHFGEWIDAAFGPGIARHFMRPYNTKVWGRPPEQMDWRWIGERVAVPDVERIAENVRQHRDDVSWGPNNTFRFPEQGGTGAIWRALVASLPAHRIRRNTRVTAVDPAEKVCHTADGEALAYGRLISTIPLTDLTCMAGLEPPPLESTSVYVLGLGLEGQPPEAIGSKCWMYFPDPDCPFYRVTVFSNYSPNNVPDARRQWSLMFELGVSGPQDEGALWDRTLACATEAGLIPAAPRIASQWSHYVPKAYPVPTLGRNEALAGVQPELESLGIFSRGRFGAWKYEVGNMDHSFMQGVEAVNRLLDGCEETTLHHPEVVNG